MDLPRDQILLGDCLDRLRTLPSESLEACVVDPPYGLGSKDPSPEDIFMYVLGCTLEHGHDFMGRDWQIPSIAVWREVYRVLKPGGYVASFGGTRTFDLISVGLRMAGFECRDTISRFYPDVELPVISWVQSQGMPKGQRISAAIDKKLGLQRKVVGTRRGRGGENLNRLARPGKGDSEAAKSMGAYGVGARQVDVEIEETLPASPEAAQWEGWNTNLKPAWEPVLLFRKPFKGTLVDNVLKNGTGALNIDATRVRHASKADFDAHKKGVDAIREKGGSRDKSWKNSSDLSGASEVQNAGRWPANAVYEHLSTCQRVGTFEVAPHPQGPARFQKTSGGGFSDAYGNQLANEEPEVISEWRCEKGCPVAALNAQSGDRPSTLTGRADPNESHDHPGTEMNPNSTFLGERTHLSKVYADAGGAARFFTQFEGGPSPQRPDGRYPSNSLWVHAEGCKQVGSKRVKGSHDSTAHTTDKAYEKSHIVYGYRGPMAKNSHTELDGHETVEAWECVDGCPVGALERQGVEAGVHAAGNKGETNHVSGKGYGGAFKPMKNNPDYHADGSSTSRFFSQFEAEGGVPFRYVAKANRKEAGCGEFEVQHITLKPLKLIQWLVRLVCKKGGTILDMYAGSGTTCHAAVLEGMHFIGIERDETNHAEAVRRLEIVLRRERERKEDEELLDFAMGRTEG